MNESSNEITVENFMHLLEKLNIIDVDGLEAKYFVDEYNLEDAEYISVETLENDYHAFVDKNGESVVEKLCFAVLIKIADYCDSIGASVKEELAMAK